MSAISRTDRPAERVSDATRWTQLVVGIICMVMIANFNTAGRFSRFPSARNSVGA